MKYTKANSITPSDGTDVTISDSRGTPNDAIFVGVAGDVNLILTGDSSAVLFKNMKAGTLYPLGVKCVQNTSTDATDIIVLQAQGVS